jgi:L-threonine kinase
MACEVTAGASLGRVALPAACGELVQGTLDGVRCLVSCPINWYSIAEVGLRPEPGWEVPADSPKAAAALRVGLAHLGRTELGGRLRLISDVPRGRGYASSTADVGAALYALGRALGQSLVVADVARLAVSVEPSDSTVFPGLALFDHRGGSFHERLGPAPPLAVVVVDPGGEVDTLAFNRQDHREVLARLAPQHREAFTLLFEGLQRGDWRAIGEAATLSARAHQAILLDPLLEMVLTLARSVGGLGVCRAHSGTVLGLLLDPEHADVSAVADFVARQLPDGVAVVRCSLVGGGPLHLPAMSALSVLPDCSRRLANPYCL